MRHVGQIVVAAIMILTVGGVIGSTLYAVTSAPAPSKLQATATTRPAPTPGAIGSVGHLSSHVLWVDEVGFLAWRRAYEDRDDKRSVEIMRLYETLMPSQFPAVRVTNRSSSSVQVEILEGPLAGRRGWTHPDALVP